MANKTTKTEKYESMFLVAWIWGILVVIVND